MPRDHFLPDFRFPISSFPLLRYTRRPVTEPATEPSPTQLKSDTRWQILAGLRFVLAMVVVSWHLPWFSPPGEPNIFAQLGGTAAVLGFLVISGYSIAHSLERRPGGYFRRRLLRIYPLYAVAVLYSLLPFVSGADALATRAPDEIFARPTVLVVIGNLLMLQNLVCPPVDADLLVWTLGIEVACYLLAPLFRKTPTSLLLILIVISSFTFAMFPRMHLRHYATLLRGLPLLMFAWAWIAGFLWQRCRTSPWGGFAVAVLGAVLLTVNTAFPARYSVDNFVGSIAIITFAGSIPLPTGFGRLLNYLGDLSYPVYLFHLPTFLLGYCIMGIRSPTVLMFAALSVSAAFLFIESFLKRVFARRSQAR